MRPYAAAKQTDSGVPMEFAIGGLTVTSGDAVILSTRSGERYATVVPDVPSSCGSCTGCATKKNPPSSYAWRPKRIAGSMKLGSHGRRKHIEAVR